MQHCAGKTIKFDFEQNILAIFLLFFMGITSLVHKMSGIDRKNLANVHTNLWQNYLAHHSSEIRGLCLMK